LSCTRVEVNAILGANAVYVPTGVKLKKRIKLFIKLKQLITKHNKE